MEIRMNYIVPYIGKGSSFDEREIDVLKELLFSVNTLSCGNKRKEFEEKFASLLGVKYAFAVTNCTVALMFASYLANIEKGDEVVCTCFTYQATILPLLDKGVKIRFCDIEPNGLGVDIECLNQIVSKKTKAIFITHYGGMINYNIQKIQKIAKENNVLLIEDCAHSLGAKYCDKPSGTFGDIACFSFHSLKNISTLGQGGMIVFNNDSWARKIQNIRATEPDAIFRPQNIGFGEYIQPNDDIFRHDKNAYTHECIKILWSGTNATLSEPACAVGTVQLAKLDAFTQRRREIADKINNVLKLRPEIIIQEEPDDYYHVYHLYTFYLNPQYKINRDRFVNKLKDRGIEIILRYFPLHLLPEWRCQGGYYGECPRAEKVWFEKIINLPIYPSLTNMQVEYMINTIEEVLDGFK